MDNSSKESTDRFSHLYKLELEEVLKESKKSEDVLSFVARSDEVDKKSLKLKALFELQKKVVRKEMHKAMSSISAISGYLELMEVLLQEEPDQNRVEQYRDKIEEGIIELNEIVEELYDMFGEEDESKNDLAISN